MSLAETRDMLFPSENLIQANPDRVPQLRHDI